MSQIESHKTQIGNVGAVHVLLCCCPTTDERTESDIVVIKSSIVENPEQMKREIGELTG